ncbi:MAG: Kae1-associated kinase Bud32 [Desulfurococcaceae archaeon]
MVALTRPVPVSRGAEAEIYLVDFFGVRAIVKKRVSKPYRNPLFDKVFIQSRTRVEARVLSELYNAGLRVPAVLLVDDENGVIVMEYIKGIRASQVFDSLDGNALVSIAGEVGRFAAQMHNMKIYHGDFTLANLLLSDHGVVVIDFGLAGYSTDIEEYAIDLHLMSRSAYVADPEKAKSFTEHVLEAYSGSYKGNAEEVIKRMREISIRGRYVDRELRKTVMRERYIE